VLLSQSASPSVVIICFSPDRHNLGFLTEGKLATIFIKPSLGVPNWPVIYFINSVASSSFWRRCRGPKEEYFQRLKKTSRVNLAPAVAKGSV
jgi:hypothetical protein